MTIQRQYILPNCNLILEGLSTAVEPTLADVMSVVMNAECHFPTAKTTLKGGREFLDGLIVAVNQYGQSFLSGLSPRQTPQAQLSAVQLQPGDGDGSEHHLLVQPQVLMDAAGNPAATKDATPHAIKLTTVQLFDLMEAVDQLVADTQTLPDLKFGLQPLSRRLVKPDEPLAKQALPAAVGISTLAAAAIAMALLPTPEVEPRNPDAVDSESSEAVTPSSPSTNTLDVDDSDAPATTVDAVTAAAILDERPDSAPNITDGETLARLQQQLTADLEAEWSGDPDVDEDLIFRIGVSESGEILGYKYSNDAALLNVDDTPLPSLTYIPVDPEAIHQEPIAQFLVTLTPDGTVTAEPIAAALADDTTPETLAADPEETIAAPDAPDETSDDTSDETPDETSDEAPDDTPDEIPNSTNTADSDSNITESSLATTLDNPVTDGEQIRALNQDLYNAIAGEFDSATYPEDIAYQVRMNDAGELVGYEPIDQVARSQANQTPLPALIDGSAATDRPQVDFRVVFTEGGVIQVSPWLGWPN